jgi:chorismate mutase/prephenate dehydratase
LRILQGSVQDNPHNTTRFLVLGKETCPRTGDDKTSIMFGVQDKTGALFRALEPFQRLKVNMSKIESRPSKRKAWEYFFFVDVDGHVTDKKVVRALNALKKHCTFVKILGSYPRSAGM